MGFGQAVSRPRHTALPVRVNNPVPLTPLPKRTCNRHGSEQILALAAPEVHRRLTARPTLTSGPHTGPHTRPSATHLEQGVHQHEHALVDLLLGLIHALGVVLVALALAPHHLGQGRRWARVQRKETV